MKMYSILLMGNAKIDVNEKELLAVQAAISRKDPLIIIGERSFAAHQFCSTLPKAEADFLEKMRLREKGFLRCKRGSIHKMGEKCECKEIGEGHPDIIDGGELGRLLVENHNRGVAERISERNKK